MKLRAWLAVALAVGMFAGPAHADKQICDTGSYASGALCILSLVPVMAVGATVMALTPDPPDKAATKAIQSGNLAQLQFVLEKHPQLLKDTEKAHGLLLAAAGAGNMAATTLLLDAGVPANTGNSRALWYATTVQEIELLLARGANADEMDLGRLSYRLGSPVAADLVDTLLKHRTDLRPDDRGAVSLLNDAIRSRKSAVVDLLLERGIDPNGAADRPALVELAYACSEADAGCTTTLQPLAQKLIDKGADVNRLARTCTTPWDAATQRRNAPLVNMLESAGAIAHPPAQEACRASLKTASKSVCCTRAVPAPTQP